jgi:hypothetical protein
MGGNGAGVEPIAAPDEDSGTSAIEPHCGHLAFFPALSSGVRNNLEQLGQRNSMGMSGS